MTDGKITYVYLYLLKYIYLILNKMNTSLNNIESVAVRILANMKKMPLHIDDVVYGVPIDNICADLNLNVNTPIVNTPINNSWDEIRMFENNDLNVSLTELNNMFSGEPDMNIDIDMNE